MEQTMEDLELRIQKLEKKYRTLKYLVTDNLQNQEVNLQGNN